MTSQMGSIFHAPRLTSTVVPGQLPICALAPVRPLKSVDFPALGAPTSAITGAPSGAMSPWLSEWQLVGCEAVEDALALRGDFDIKGSFSK